MIGLAGTSKATAAVRILEAVRPDLLLTMRLLDRESTAAAHLRLTMCVAALDDALVELGQ